MDEKPSCFESLNPLESIGVTSHTLRRRSDLWSVRMTCFTYTAPNVKRGLTLRVFFFMFPFYWQRGYGTFRPSATTWRRQEGSRTPSRSSSARRSSKQVRRRFTSIFCWYWCVWHCRFRCDKVFVVSPCHFIGTILSQNSLGKNSARANRGMGFFAWYASASSATATQFKILRAVPKFCVHSKGEVLSADLFYGVS